MVEEQDFRKMERPPRFKTFSLPLESLATSHMVEQYDEVLEYREANDLHA